MENEGEEEHWQRPTREKGLILGELSSLLRKLKAETAQHLEMILDR